MAEFNGPGTTLNQMTLLEAFNHIKYFADNYYNGSVIKAVEQLEHSYEHITDDSKEAIKQYNEWHNRMIAWKQYVSN